MKLQKEQNLNRAGIENLNVDEKTKQWLRQLLDRLNESYRYIRLAFLNFMPNRMSTTDRDKLSAQNGMIIYNTTTNRIEAYENGSWVDL